jgi:hypothetical protein
MEKAQATKRRKRYRLRKSLKAALPVCGGNRLAYQLFLDSLKSKSELQSFSKRQKYFAFYPFAFAFCLLPSLDLFG